MHRSSSSRFAFAFVPVLALAACGTSGNPSDGSTDVASDATADAPPVRTPYTGPVPPDRAAGARTPLSQRCDAIDETRCQLPWPSNTFTVVDPASPTGLRVHADPSNAGPGDTVEPLNRADGFSRATPLAAGFPGRLDPMSLGDGTTGAMRLFVSQPGPNLGRAIALRITPIASTRMAREEGLMLGYPRAPLAPATDHVAVVMDSARFNNGMPVTASIATRVALGLEPPASAEEAALFAYHAPTRALLRNANVDFAHVVRVWDFTTRSADQPRRALRAMREAGRRAVDMGSIGVTFGTVTVPADGPIAAIVQLTLTGLPEFRTEQGALRRDAAGLPVAMGTHSAPFRLMLPRGTGNYRVVLFGHGTGGNERDDSFDRELAEVGAAKIGLRFNGLTDEDTLSTFDSLERMLEGADQLTGKLSQAFADGLTLLHALRGPLGDALAAPMLGTTPNPVAGRRPDLTHAMWAGGSLGGTSGLVLSSAEPEFDAAVLNVPGAAWTHFLTLSNLFTAVSLVLRGTYVTPLDIHLAIATGQGVLDEVDGCAWADARDPAPPRLFQESIGDPVLPNPGTEFAAAASGAVMIGAPIVPVLGVSSGPYTGGAALTQFRVPASVTSPLDVHGFGAKGSPAGIAAREQIVSFVQSVWAGTPTVTVPPTCASNTPANSCDFSTR